MASIATYGTAFEDNEVNLVTLSRATRYSPRQKRLNRTDTVHCFGEIQKSSTADIITRIQAIEAILRDDYKDFRYTVGGTPAHSLLNSGDCLSGVRVVNVSFPKGDGAELATKRSFSFTLQATYDVQETDLVSWTETIEQQGDGGPISFLMNTIGGPMLMFVTARSAIAFVQAGMAVGYKDYPAPGAPAGTVQQGFRSSVTRTSGRQVGNGLRFFTTKWRYILLHDPAFGTFDPRPVSQ